MQFEFAAFQFTEVEYLVDQLQQLFGVYLGEFDQGKILIFQFIALQYGADRAQ